MIFYHNCSSLPLALASLDNICICWICQGSQRCKKQIYIPHSCGHRFCPHCQSHESQQWIDNQRAKLLPMPCYLVTFTLPRHLLDLAYKNHRHIYACVFQADQTLLKTITTHDTKLGGDARFTAMLHTHARNLDIHPHIHVVTLKNENFCSRSRHKRNVTAGI
jgi:hypothetical protein